MVVLHEVARMMVRHEAAVVGVEKRRNRAAVASVVVQLFGAVLVVPTSAFSRLEDRGYSLRLILWRHRSLLQGQVMQFAACNARLFSRSVAGALFPLHHRLHRTPSTIALDTGNAG